MYSDLVDFAECVTAVNVSVKDQLNLSVSVAVGSSIVSSLLLFFHTKLMLVQANHSPDYSVSAYHVHLFAAVESSCVKVHGYPWVDHGQATGFAV